MIELMVVISIILILVSAVLASLGMLRRRQMELSTRTTIGNISLAITSYLTDYGVLGSDPGDSGDDFAAAPLQFLASRRASGPYLDIARLQMVDVAGEITSNPSTAAMPLDAYGDPLRLEITNARVTASSPRPDYTANVRIISGRGTPELTDDLVYEFDHERDSWEWVRAVEP